MGTPGPRPYSVWGAPYASAGASFQLPMKLSTSAVVSISACIGIAISDADSTVSGLLKHADLAQHQGVAFDGCGVVGLVHPQLVPDGPSLVRRGQPAEAVADPGDGCVEPVVDVLAGRAPWSPS